MYPAAIVCFEPRESAASQGAGRRRDTGRWCDVQKGDVAAAIDANAASQGNKGNSQG